MGAANQLGADRLACRLGVASRLMHHLHFAPLSKKLHPVFSILRQNPEPGLHMQKRFARTNG
jgi:hypothetical protein